MPISKKLRYNAPFTIIDKAVIQSESLSVYDKALYAILCSYASSDGSCYPSYSTLARKAGCSRRKVIAVISNLEELGLLEKQPQVNSVGDSTSNLYTIKPMGDALYSPPSSACQSPPDAPNSPPGAGDTPELYPNINNKVNNIHPSISAEERMKEWKQKISYDYFEAEMPSKLILIDSLLGYFCELKDDGHAETQRLLCTVDELAVLEFLDEMNGKTFAHVRSFKAYMKAMLLEFLRKREIELAVI